MSTLRSDDDTWDIATSVGATAVTSQDEMRRLDRAVVLEQTDDNAFALFVAAEKR